MQNIIQRINKSLDNLGAPPLMKGRHEYLAQLVGTTTRTVRRWFAEQVTIPKTNLSKLAEVLNVSFTWLETGEGCQRRTPNYIHLNESEGVVPILAWDDETISLWLQNKYAINYEQNEFRRFLLDEMSESSFVLVVHVIDMMPLIPLGSYLFIDPKQSPHHENIVLVRKYDGLTPLIRYYIKKREDFVLLEAMSPGITTTKLTELDEVLGVVKKIIPPDQE